jgi:hypothetical protein
MIVRKSEGGHGIEIARDRQLHQMPRWLRLRKERQEIVGETSFDGIKWNQVGRANMEQVKLTFTGLATTSAKGDVLASSAYDDLTIEEADAIERQAGL